MLILSENLSHAQEIIENLTQHFLQLFNDGYQRMWMYHKTELSK